MKLKKGRVILVLLIILMVIGLAVFITNKNKPKKNMQVGQEENTIYEDNIRFGVSNFDTINPILTNNRVMININQLVYEPLVEFDNTYKIKNCLAREIAKTSTNTYIVKIDNSIKWSDGSDFSANDVKYTIDIIKTRNNIFSENVKEIKEVSVIDDNTIKIALNNEIPFFEYNLTFPIMCQKHYAQEDFFSSSKTPIGTGKYKIESISNNQIILSKNTEYRNNQQVNEKIDKIYINIFNEIGEVYNSFKVGNVDMLSVSSTKYKNYIGTLGYYVKDYAGREYDFLSCNCTDNILKDKQVRQAICCVIDKDNIISNIYNNEYYKACYPLDYGNYLYSNNYIEDSYNVEKAKEILRNAGWKNSNNTWRKNGILLRINLSVNSSNKSRVEAAKLIKQQLEAVGILVNLRELSDAEYSSVLSNKKYQLILTGIYNGYSPNLEFFYGNNNLANYSNETVTALINEIKNITDEKLLKEKFEQLIKTTYEDYAYIGLYRNKCSLVVSKKMSGNFEPNNFELFSNSETWNRER